MISKAFLYICKVLDLSTSIPQDPPFFNGGIALIEQGEFLPSELAWILPTLVNLWVYLKFLSLTMTNFPLSELSAAVKVAEGAIESDL